MRERRKLKCRKFYVRDQHQQLYMLSLVSPGQETKGPSTLRTDVLSVNGSLLVKVLKEHGSAHFCVTNTKSHNWPLVAAE